MGKGARRDQPARVHLTLLSCCLSCLVSSCRSWVFQSATSFVSSTGSSILLLNGAQAKNVYFYLATSATLANDASFAGSISAGTTVALQPSATVVGRLFSQTDVTFAGNDKVTLPLA